MAVRPSVIIVSLCVGLAACGARLGIGSDKPKTAAAPVASTPAQRATQVAWTAASARYCAFGLNPQKLKSDYLTWERSRGVPEETIQTLDTTYDKAFFTFYNKVKSTPGYCTKAQIEEIRPEINRHLAGDYEPKRTAPEPVQTPLTNLHTPKKYDENLQRALIPPDSQ